ncbi:SRPBCC family protein [Roseibium sp.]|uniref:SRPBCC family protein n=1 Tax=Roseibium sp. TaxID=1936156 RepID=UPI003D0A2D0E
MTLEKSVVIHAPRDAVFAALSDPAEITRHFPYDRVESEDVEGGLITFHGSIGGQAFTDFGRITRRREGAQFEYRYWSTNHGTERSEENELEIRYRLEQHGKATALFVTHSLIRNADYLAMMDGAWDGLLLQLKTNLETGE